MSVYFTRRGPAPALGKRASDYAVGDIVKLRENGVPVEYLVVHQGLPGAMYDASCDGTWLLRVVRDGIRVWHGVNKNNYAESDINTYLQNDWMNRFDWNTRRFIKSVKIPYVKGTGNDPVASGGSGLLVTAFMLSVQELGVSSSQLVYLPPDGLVLDYFKGTTSADAKRIANNEDGAPVSYWTRSPLIMNTLQAWRVSFEGGFSSKEVAYPEWGPRPAHILRSDTLFDPETNILKG